VFAALVVGSAAWAQTTLETLNLEGPVAAVEEYREFPGTTERQLFQTWAFDEAGLATERVYFTYSYMDGSPSGRQVTSYDAGRTLATVVYDADDEPTGQTVVRYDDQDRIVAQVTVDADGVETRRIDAERDAAGNVVRETWYRDGAVSRTIERDFDADGGLIEQRRYDEEGRLVEVESYTVPGLEHDSVQYDEEGEVEATGRVIENEFGTVLIEVLAPDGTVAESYAWTYDERGRVVERRSVYGEGETELLTYDYEDDDQGNWVRQVTTEDLGNGPETYEIRDRTITYR
jgi:YD repeat-containing protein